MSFSLIYLIQRFFYRIFQFFYNWHVDGFFWVFHKVFNILEKLDRNLALKITLRNLFRPLYQDYTFLGYILGFIFRTGRVLLASVLYFAILLAGLGIYIFWAAIPIYLIYKFFAL